MQDDPAYVREAFGAGAKGYVLKEAVDAEEVGGAIREVAEGAVRASSTGARGSSPPKQRSAPAEEDPSQIASGVLRLPALGHTNQEIAEALFLSVRTVETHRAHIMQKLRISTAPSWCAMRSPKVCSGDPASPESPEQH